MKEQNNRNESMIEGRNAVLEAFRSGKTVDKLYILDGCQDGPVRTIDQVTDYPEGEPSGQRHAKRDEPTCAGVRPVFYDACYARASHGGGTRCLPKRP